MLTTRYPDALPVLTHARSDDLRRRMRIAFDTRAYPANMDVLDRMLARRDELAHLLGFASWVDCATADKMVGSAANASVFVGWIVEASGPAAEAEYRMLLERKRRDDAVKRGALDISSRLFGVSFRRATGAPAWDPSVEVWEMFEEGRRVGRF